MMPLQRTELVEFDPKIKAHRDAVRKFMVRRAWADSPLRFKHNPEYASVVDQVQEMLCVYYLARESSPARVAQAA